MRILWFCALLHLAFSAPEFGTSYLKNSRLCHQWSCINSKLGLTDTLPPREQYDNVLRTQLPAGVWQATVGKVLDVCYGDRPRRYTNTCPGQDLMHCVIDHLIQNCPEQSWRKDDACAPVTTLAGFKNMFTQSRFENIEKNLHMDVHPSWFLKNYFNSKCCDLPPLLNTTLLNECGFSSLLDYRTQNTPRPSIVPYNKFEPRLQPTEKRKPDPVKVVDINACHQWSCINSKLGLTDTLPPREQYGNVLRTQLPAGAWQATVGKVLDVCYGNRPRRYMNACSGQALMHCVIDQLIQNCPEQSWRKDDACVPVLTLVGAKYMFSQSRYENLEKNLPTEVRPSRFLKNYFKSKCCDLPPLLNTTLLNECGFSTFINHYTHTPRPSIVPYNTYAGQPQTTERIDPDAVKVVDISENHLGSTIPPNGEDTLKVVNINNMDQSNDVPNPLDCCDMSEFIQPAWRSECDFQLSWTGSNRLSIQESIHAALPTPTTTAKPVKMTDVKIVPMSCDQQTCVFKKLNIVSETGSVDVDAFSKLLNNFTDNYPDWAKAKARVVTKCLARPINEYVEDCEINKVLACTFDVLSENCPHAKKTDSCRHSNVVKKNVTCQISASKFRPKSRRQFCGLPNLVNHEVLAECGMNSLSRVEYVPEPAITKKPKRFNWWSPGAYACKELTESTKCVLNKMGVLNKYTFMDYFKMKDYIRHSTEDPVWSALNGVYLSAFTSMPMYKDQCSSPKKLLNIVDTMLMTCPISKRKQTAQCLKLFSDIANTAPINTRPVSDMKLNNIWRHFNRVFLPQNMQMRNFTISTSTAATVKTHRNPTYNYGFLNSNDAPPVKILDLKPKQSKKPLVILPVYLRMNSVGQGSVSIRPYKDLALRSDPFALQIAMAHASTTPANLE